jgi:hypothetical protein
MINSFGFDFCLVFRLLDSPLACVDAQVGAPLSLIAPFPGSALLCIFIVCTAGLHCGWKNFYNCSLPFISQMHWGGPG